MTRLNSSAARTLAAIGVALGGWAAVVVLTGFAYSGPSTSVGRIVFVGAFGASEIYTINPDGTGRRRLTSDDLSKTYPAWSPDGRKIVYTALTSARSSDVFVMNANGSHRRRLTYGALIYGAGWSYDGSRLILTVQRPSGTFDLDVMGSDGRNRHALFPRSADRRGGNWSPDGRLIEYSSGGKVFVVQPDGTGQIGVPGRFGAWLPSGNGLAIIRRSVVRVGVNGAFQGVLVRRRAGVIDMSISGDSRRIVFSDTIDGGSEIHLFVADIQSGLVREISGPDSEMPDWQKPRHAAAGHLR